ncbi:unnamed protein product [Symbiodinium sp. CCMP2592]|nr:unnamed protein product [Symbiodinium sp. CCMP2592]
MSETQLVCQKCRDPVLLENSHASGRNALKRVCTGCAATDKSLQRSCKTKVKGADETPAEQDMRMKAEKVKSEVAKMSEEDRAEWYKKQKAKREAEGFSNKRRTFESGVGIVEENRSRHSGSDDVARWTRFRDWAATERLVTGCSPEELPTRWKRELDKPTSQTKTVNGEVLLRVWTGLEDRDGSRHSITAGLKQRCDLHNSEDLEAFGTQADMRLQRGETLLRADRMSSDAAGVVRETPLLQIQADMEASSKMRMAAEALLYEEAEKIEEKRRQLLSQRPKVSSAALEKLQYESSISRARSSCEASLYRFKTALKTVKLEIEQMSENDPTTMVEMKTRSDKFEEIYKGAEQYLEETIEKWTTALESNPSDTSDEAAEKWHQYFMDVSAFVKTFASKDAVKKVKDNLAEIRAWCAEYKKGCNKKKRLSVSSANKAATQAVENISEDQGVVFAAADWVEKENQAFALVLAAAQNQQLLQEWLELPYYEQQKTWLAESWKKGSGPELSTNVVAKPQLCTKLNKDWMSCLGNASKHIKDIYFTADYALTEFKMCLEGTSVCCGFQINTTMMKDGFKAFCDATLATDPNDFLKICQKKGWIVHLSPGKALGIPAGHCYCQMAQDITHGCRVLKLRASDDKSSVGLLTARIADYPELIGLRTGRLLNWISGSQDAAAAAAHFGIGPPTVSGGVAVDPLVDVCLILMDWKIEDFWQEVLVFNCFTSRVEFRSWELEDFGAVLRALDTNRATELSESGKEDLWGANAAFICGNSPQQVPVADLGNFDVLLKATSVALANGPVISYRDCNLHGSVVRKERGRVIEQRRASLQAHGEIKIVEYRPIQRQDDIVAIVMTAAGASGTGIPQESEGCGSNLRWWFFEILTSLPPEAAIALNLAFGALSLATGWGWRWAGIAGGWSWSSTGLAGGSPQMPGAWRMLLVSLAPQPACAVTVGAYNVPLSWHKLQCGYRVKWIGWLFNFRSGTFSLPTDKIEKILRSVRVVLRPGNVDRCDLEKTVGLLQWVSQISPELRPWMAFLYSDLHRPVATNHHVDSGEWHLLHEYLDDNLRFTSQPPGTAIPRGARLLSARHIELHSKQDLNKVPLTSRRIYMRISDPKHPKRKLSECSRKFMEFWESWCMRSPLEQCLHLPPRSIACTLAADACAQGSSIGIGGFLRVEGSSVLWFSERFAKSDFDDLNIPLDNNTQKNIGAGSSWLKLLWRFFLQRLARADDAGFSCASANRLMTTSSPLCFFAQQLAFVAFRHGITLDVHHISGFRNEEADYLSRWNGTDPLLPEFAETFRYRYPVKRMWQSDHDVRVFPKGTRLLWSPP